MTTQRLLVLTTSYPLREDSTSGVFVQRLLENLPAKWAVEVLCPADASVEQLPASRISVLPVHYAPRRYRVVAQYPGGILPAVRERPWRIVLVLMLMLSMLWHCWRRAKHADVIHANWVVSGVIAGIVGAIRKKPVVTTLRGSDVARARRSWMERAALSYVVKASSRVACVSQAMTSDLKSEFIAYAGRIQCCENGVDSVFFQVQRERMSGGDRTSLISVGSLIPVKGFDLLIRALGRLQSSHFTLRIAGSGPENQYLQQLAKSLGVQSCVEFLGDISPRDMPGFLASGDVFVLCSRSEGRPNVVLEALAAGLPIVASDLPGVKDLVEDGFNGWIFQPDDLDGLTEALRRVQESSKVRSDFAMCAASRAKLILSDWTASARCHADLYESALANMRRRG